MDLHKMNKTIDELNRITGLSLQYDKSASMTEEEYLHVTAQLQTLITAYKEKHDQKSVMKRWVTGDIDNQELLHSAKRFHIETKASRALLLIESTKEIDNMVFTILANSFPNSSNYWFLPMDSNLIAMVITFPRKACISQIAEQAYLVMDILNTEAMMRVKIAYSSMTEHLNQLPDAYRETSLALKVCQTFYPEQNIYAYNNLGIGRLIYGLSKEQCITYMKESICEDYMQIMQADTAHTFNCFFDHNLNIAETARQLHMHRNTFIYRLEQIQKHTGLDVRQFHDAMIFKTALLVMNYLNTLDKE